MNQDTMIEDEIDLKELFKTILKYKKFIFIFTLLITLVSIVYAYSKQPIYEVKSNLQIGFIGKDLITDPATLIKTVNLVFNVEDKISSKSEFVSEVTSISANKKLKNFIEVKTQAISNDEALKKNKEVVDYIQKKYKIIIEQYVSKNINNIKSINQQINNLENLETKNLKRQIELLKTQKIVKIDEKIKRLKNQDIKNLQRQIELLKTQKIVKIDEKIKFYQTIKLSSLSHKIKFQTKKLQEYTKAINDVYTNNKSTDNVTLRSISSMQMVNYQNLILNAQNKLEDLALEKESVQKKLIPDLEIEKKNIYDVTIKDLELKIDNINNISIVNLEREKKNIKEDTLRKLEYKLKVELANKKGKLLEQIEVLKFQNSEQNIQNTKVIGSYIVKNYPIKPKKKLIIIVAFITSLIMAIFMIFIFEFFRDEKILSHKS